MHENAGKLFLLIEVGLGILFAYLLLRTFLRSTTESKFRVREADLERRSHGGAPRLRVESDFEEAGPDDDTGPILLTGIRIDGPPHEILGIPPTAPKAEVQRAYRNLMKQYHPDKVGRPGTRQWKDAQKIAEAINRAKEEMLKKHQ